MRLAILSDIHGNLPALEAVAARIRDVEQVVCLGDVVNYGPWNDECLELLRTLPRLVLLEGNHEALFLGKEPLGHELPLVQQFFHASIASFTRRDLIADLPLEVTIGGFLFTHTLDGRKVYRDTEIQPPGDCFLGHTHHAFEVRRGGFRVINPGSVGQNRARLDLACHALWDTDTQVVSLEQTPYPARQMLDEMRARRYPAECLAYYESKL